MRDGSIEAQVAELPAMLLAGVRCEGGGAGSGEHWQRFRAWVIEKAVVSSDTSVLAIAYAPPLAFGAATAVELCVPVEAAPAGAAREPMEAPYGMMTRTLGGRFVLASGTPEDVRALVRAARGFAAAHGFAFERGSIAIYRPGGTEDALRVDAGVRLHE